MGVQRIDAIDTEEGAVERAGRKIGLNRCGGIALARLLKSDETLIASGVIDRWDAMVRKCFEDNGLELIEHDRLGDGTVTL